RFSEQGQGNAPSSLPILLFWQKPVLLAPDADLFSRYHVAVQRERRGLANLDRDDAADQALVALEDDDVIGHRPPGQLPQPLRLEPRLAQPLDQSLDGLPDEPAMIGKTDAALDRQQIVIAAFLDFLGHVVRMEIIGPGARPRRILEDEAVLEPG